MDSSPYNFPGENTGVGSHSLLQGIFLTQGSNRGLLHCRQILYRLSTGKLFLPPIPDSPAVQASCILQYRSKAGAGLGLAASTALLPGALYLGLLKPDTWAPSSGQM